MPYDTDVSFRAAGLCITASPTSGRRRKETSLRASRSLGQRKDNTTSVRGGFAIAYDHFGSGVIDSYQSNPQSLLSLSQTNLATYTDINSNPRFTGYHDVPPCRVPQRRLPLPYTPAESPFTFDYSINDHQKTPYAETFNLTFSMNSQRASR